MDAGPRTLRRASFVSVIVALAFWTLASGTTAAEDQARRLVSLVPAVTEMLFAIGAGPEVVGVSTYDAYPPEAATRTKVGALVDPDFEKILALRPGLVIVYGTQTDLIGRLTRVGIPMYRYEHAGLADVTSTIRQVADRVGRAAQGRELADGIEAEIAAVRARVSGRARPKTALIFGREAGTLRGVYASGGIGFLHDLLLTAGGADAFGDIARQSVQASVEMLLARAPDVILELHGSSEFTPAQLSAERAIWRQLPSLPAVRGNRIYLLTDDALMIPGPRIATAARQMAAALHPQ